MCSFFILTFLIFPYVSRICHSIPMHHSASVSFYKIKKTSVGLAQTPFPKLLGDPAQLC